MSHAKVLRQLVNSQLTTFVEAKGFAREKSTHPLFQTYRRVVQDRVQVFNVQWDKCSKPRFVLNFGEGPLQGVRLWGKDIPGYDLQPQDCPESGRLQLRRGMLMCNWFQLRKPWMEALLTMERSYSPEAVTHELLRLFPEIERWWDGRVVGPHIDIAPGDGWKKANQIERP